MRLEKLLLFSFTVNFPPFLDDIICFLRKISHMISHKYYYFATLFMKLQEKIQKKNGHQKNLPFFWFRTGKTAESSAAHSIFMVHTKNCFKDGKKTEKEQHKAAPKILLF